MTNALAEGQVKVARRHVSLVQPCRSAVAVSPGQKYVQTSVAQSIRTPVTRNGRERRATTSATVSAEPPLTDEEWKQLMSEIRALAKETLSTSEEFAAAKQAEIDIEDRRNGNRA